MARFFTRSRVALFAVGAALLLAAALIATSRLSADSSPAAQPDAGTGEAAPLLEGIPQRGTALGQADAPVTLVEYADLQCPYCAQWTLGTFPELVRDYVRDGELRVEFRGLAFIGPDSETALRAALAAGRQDRLWDVVELLYANQGPENSGWVTEELIAGIAASVPGLDAERFQADRESPEVVAEMAKSEAEAQAAGVKGTPSFELGPTGGQLQPLQLTSLGPEEFRRAIDALLAG